ncbi:MAG: hypothetical protein QM278_09380 [Pseudomonadota bacterium]|nr:hypothetical protein [Pseudomonadota bacterium]
MGDILGLRFLPGGRMLGDIGAGAAGKSRGAPSGAGLPAPGRGVVNSRTFPQDTFSLPPALEGLLASGIDLSNSSFAESARALSFDLRYRSESLRQLSLQGYYDYRSENLSVDISFISALTFRDLRSGEERHELFRFNLHLEADYSLTRAGSRSVEKEDILRFARKLIMKIAKLHAEGKEIDGLRLDQEDLQELAQVDDGKLLEKIMALIEMIKIAARMKQKNGEHVWVELEREKGIVSRETEREEKKLAFSLSVERLSEESRVSGPAPEAEPAAHAQAGGGAI